MISKEVKWLVIIIFFFSLIFHITMAQMNNPNLGLLMAIPLFSYLLIHIILFKKPIKQDLALQLPRKKDLLLSIFTPILLGLLINGVFYYSKKGIFLFEQVSELLPLLLIGLTIATFSALLEEIIWRGYLHSQLRKIYSFHKTACITALIWSFWHVPIALFYKSYTNIAIGTFSYLAILFIVSYILSYLREQSRSVIPAAIFHGLMNVLYFGDGIEMQLPLQTIEVTKLILLCVFFFILLRLTKKSPFDNSI
ncbi:CPBP family intramembrane glutamic endopeptidase [Solibacillus daqui]|uniref:CPBP family intramembrane glutamic endopeptidase n=1 Tax=Solibacillus daqui TaxID=2912187 RepID=UPI0023663524|nr:type II CAAX endopeptidase family protein [Solibacillus daqui]